MMTDAVTLIPQALLVFFCWMLAPLRRIMEVEHRPLEDPLPLLRGSCVHLHVCWREGRYGR